MCSWFVRRKLNMSGGWCDGLRRVLLTGRSETLLLSLDWPGLFDVCLKFVARCV